MVEAREGAHDVGRTASAVEPSATAVSDGPALVRLRSLAQLQGVDVEILGAGQRDPGKERIEQQPLDRIGVLRLAGSEQQSPGPLDRADRRAGFGIATVRSEEHTSELQSRFD